MLVLQIFGCWKKLHFFICLRQTEWWLSSHISGLAGKRTSITLGVLLHLPRDHTDIPRASLTRFLVGDPCVSLIKPSWPIQGGDFAPDPRSIAQKVIGPSPQLLSLRPQASQHCSLPRCGYLWGTVWKHSAGDSLYQVILPSLLYAAPSSDQPFPAFSIHGSSFLSDSSVLHLHGSLIHQESHAQMPPKAMQVKRLSVRR